jgi:hypothetical protein
MVEVDRIFEVWLWIGIDFFKFHLVFKVRFLMQYECMMPYNMSVLYVPHQKKRLTKYRWRAYSRWENTLIPIVSSNGMTYANVITVPTEEHNRYMTYTTTYPPCDVHAFNVARIALYTLRERIHALKKRPQDIPRSPCPRCVVMTNHTTDT